MNFTNALASATRTQSSVAGTGSSGGSERALTTLYRNMQAESSAMSYVDVFAIAFVVGVVMFILSFFLKANEPGKGEAVAA